MITTPIPTFFPLQKKALIMHISTNELHLLLLSVLAKYSINQNSTIIWHSKPNQLLEFFISMSIIPLQLMPDDYCNCVPKPTNMIHKDFCSHDNLRYQLLFFKIRIGENKKNVVEENTLSMLMFCSVCNQHISYSSLLIVHYFIAQSNGSIRFYDKNWQVFHLILQTTEKLLFFQQI